MKIRIVGSCGSGKSTAGKAIFGRYGIPFYEIDNMVWDRSAENRRYPVEIRDARLREVLRSDAWVVEGVHTGWTAESFGGADLIFILNPSVWVRDYRIVRRFVRSRLGIEPGNYRQTFANLRKMLVRWNHGYDLNEVMEMTDAYSVKRFVVKRGEELMNIIEDRISARNALTPGRRRTTIDVNLR